LPGIAEGILSVFIPSLSKFIFISPDNGDVDPYFPVVYLYFEDSSCQGNSYVDIYLRYQVFGFGSKFYTPDNLPAETKIIQSVSTPELGGECISRSPGSIPVLTYKEVALPFTMPVAPPLQFEY
jgi:hypothetical protein